MQFSLLGYSDVGCTPANQLLSGYQATTDSSGSGAFTGVTYSGTASTIYLQASAGTNVTSCTAVSVVAAPVARISLGNVPVSVDQGALFATSATGFVSL